MGIYGDGDGMRSDGMAMDYTSDFYREIAEEKKKDEEHAKRKREICLERSKAEIRKKLQRAGLCNIEGALALLYPHPWDKDQYNRWLSQQGMLANE